MPNTAAPRLSPIAVERLTRILDETPAFRLAVMFGSSARGTATGESDLDIGVILDGAANLLPALGVALERAAGRPIDLVMLNQAPPLLRFEIARDGQLLLERDPHAWSDFRAHAMIDWWDWAPTARLAQEVMMVRLKEEAQRGPA